MTKRAPKSSKKCCANYRERISECRNCVYSDGVFKECFRQKKGYAENRNGLALFKSYIK